jgi:hypothetical protein
MGGKDRVTDPGFFRANLFVFVVGIVLCAVTGSPCNTLTLKCVSWNVQGVQKFTPLTPELGYLEEFDAIFLQETFTTSAENGLDLVGYIPYHVLGRVTGGCPSWGLTMLVKID